MKFLFINSMSRTGTSLLYQLLYGHSKIYFAPYRIQFVCSKPFGFPLMPCNNDFLTTLMRKTTIIHKAGDWPNILTETLAKLYTHKIQSCMVREGSNLLETAIYTIHSLLGIRIPSCEYYCLHDDHSYMLGSSAFMQFQDSKILTTLRNPFEMIASKKNMLVMYAYGRENPKKFFLAKEVLENELLRAVFSWWAASVEHCKAMAIVYARIKDIYQRRVAMQSVAQYLGIPFEACMESDKVILENEGLHNELLANGSSLSTIEYLTQNKILQKINGLEYALNLQEIEYLQHLLGVCISCFESFENFLKISDGILFKDAMEEQFCAWKTLYARKNMEVLFESYSALNYGRANAQSAFVRGGGHYY